MRNSVKVLEKSHNYCIIYQLVLTIIIPFFSEVL